MSEKIELTALGSLWSAIENPPGSARAGAAAAVGVGRRSSRESRWVGETIYRRPSSTQPRISSLEISRNCSLQAGEPQAYSGRRRCDNLNACQRASWGVRRAAGGANLAGESFMSGRKRVRVGAGAGTSDDRMLPALELAQR